MEFEITVRFQTEERRIITEKLLPNVGVAYGAADQQYDEARRRVNHIAGGDYIRHTHLQQAIEIAERTVEACEEQAEPQWWIDNVASGKGGGVSLVANPEQFAKDMAANRMSQARQAAEAWSLLKKAESALLGGMVAA